jgi:hypothetical protein
MLGELLLAQGLITQAQLARALQMHRQFGERLGTTLIELGCIDMDTLARALSAQHRVPAVLEKHVAAIDPRFIALFPARVAKALFAIPLGYTRSMPQRLIVALRDPLTTATQELAFAAGTRIDAGVAPELLIRRCLQRYYGLKIETARLTGQSAAAAWTEMDFADEIRRPEPSLSPPLSSPAVTPPGTRDPARPSSRPILLSAPPPPSTRVARLLEPPPMPEDEGGALQAPARDSTHEEPEENESFDDEPVRLPEEPIPISAPSSMPGARPPPTTLEMPEAPPNFTRPSGAVATTGVVSGDQKMPDDDGWDEEPLARGPSRVPSPLTAPPVMLVPMLDVTAAIEALRASTTREEIGETLATWLQSTYGFGLVLIVKDGTALGWKGYAPDAERELIESIAMPLGPPSMLKDAYEKRTVFLGAPPAEGMAFQTRLWKLLRCKAPMEVLVAPVVLGTRVVNLLYAHAEGDAVMTPSAKDDITRVAAVASTEYARLIRNRK